MGKIINEENCSYYVQDDGTKIFIGYGEIKHEQYYIVGMDSRIKPGVARVFLDSSEIKKGTIGMFQLVQFLVNGIPVPPSIIGEELAYMNQYMVECANGLWSFNMIHPESIKASSLEVEQKCFPFYQYNGSLTQPNKSKNDYQFADNGNGAIVMYPVQSQKNKAECPYIKMPIGIDFTTITLKDLLTLMSSGNTVFEEVTIPEDIMKSRGFYNVIFDEFTAEISEFESVQVIGEHILFQIINMENMSDYFLFFYDVMAKEYRLYAMDTADIVSLCEEKQLELINRVNEYFDEMRINRVSQEMDEITTGRGKLFGDELDRKQADNLTIDMKCITMGVCEEDHSISQTGIMLDAVAKYSYDARNFLRPVVYEKQIISKDYETIITKAFSKYVFIINQSQTSKVDIEQQIWFDAHSFTEGE